MRKFKIIFVIAAVAAFVVGSGFYSAEGMAGEIENDKLWEWVVPPQYAFAQPFENGFAAVSNGQMARLPNGEVAEFPLWGLIDRNGNLVVPIEYDWVGTMNGVLRISRTELFDENNPDSRLSGWMPDGTAIAHRTWTVEADGSLTPFHDDPNRFDWTWEVFIPGSYFDIDTREVIDRATGEVLIPSHGESSIINPFSSGFAAVLATGGWGLINANNEVIIPFEYDYISSFIDNQLLGPHEVSWIDEVSGNTVTRGIHRGDKWGLVNRQGDIVVDLIYDVFIVNEWIPTGIADFYKGIAAVSQNGKWGAIDVWGNVVVPIRYEFVSTMSGLAAAKNEAGFFGAYDNTGRLVVPFEYDEILGFVGDRISVRKDGRIGFVNLEGELVIESTFDDTWGFQGDFAAVSRNGRWGFINKSGEVVIPLVYDAVWGYSEGIATVQMGGKWGFVRPISGADASIAVLANNSMDDTRFVNLQIDNPLTNNNAVLTQIDEDNEEVVPIIENNRTLVPVRFISESFDIDVSWDAETQTVALKNNDTIIELIIDSNQAFVDGAAVYIDVAPVIRNGRTLVPVRFISEILGFDVDWREADRVIEIQQ